MDLDNIGDGFFDFNDLEEAETTRISKSDTDRCNRERQRAPIHWTPPAVAPKVNDENTGIFYSLEFPVSEGGLQSLGAEWLTDAMRAAGTLTAGNSIRSFKSVQRLNDSLSGAMRLLLSVAYQQEHVSLHKKLLMKVSTMDPGEDVRESQSNSDSCCSEEEEELGKETTHKHRRVPFPFAPLEPFDCFTEINFYRLYEDRSPYNMPKFYYGDICRDTGNSVLITEYVPLPEDNKSFGGSQNVNHFFIQDQFGNFLTTTFTSGGRVHTSRNKDSNWTLQNLGKDGKVLLSTGGLYLISNSETADIMCADWNPFKENGANSAHWTLIPDRASNGKFRIQTSNKDGLLASPQNFVFLSSDAKVSRGQVSDSRHFWHLLPVDPDTHVSKVADSDFSCFNLNGMQLADCRSMLLGGAQLAAMHKVGELGPPELVETFQKPVEQTQDSRFGTLTDQVWMKKAARVQDFMTRGGSRVFPEGIIDRKLMKEYRSMITSFKGGTDSITWYLNFETDYIALGRGRMDVNSAIKINYQPSWSIGFHDWEGISVGPLGAKIWQWLRYASMDVLEREVDNLLQEFIGNYRKFGGPELSFPVLRLHFAMGAALDSLLLLDSIDEIYRACPRDQWRSITSLYDEPILKAKTPSGSLWQCLKSFVNISLLLKHFRVSEMTNVSLVSIKRWHALCSDPIEFVVTVQDKVEVRDGPSSSSRLLASLPARMAIMVIRASTHLVDNSDRSVRQLRISDGYVAVKAPITGWILAEHLSYVEDLQEPLYASDLAVHEGLVFLLGFMQSTVKEYIGTAEGMSVIAATKLFDEITSTDYFTSMSKRLNAGQAKLVHGSFLAQVERCDWWPEDYEHWAHHSFVRFENGSIADIGARTFDDVPQCWYPADTNRYELDGRKADESNWIRHHVVGIEKWKELTRASENGRKRNEWWLKDSGKSVLSALEKNIQNDQQVALTNTSDFIALRHGTPLPLPPVSRQVELKGSRISIRRLTTKTELEVSLIEDLFDDNVVDMLLNCCNARDGFQPSLVNTSDGKGIAGSQRTSWSCAMHWHSASSNEYAETWKANHAATEDQQQKELQLVREVAGRCAAVLQVSTSHIEPLQLVKYTPGQFFKPHLDSHIEPQRNSAFGEQRTHTLLVFLNDVPASDGGGCLHFPLLGLKIRPRKGCAVIWKNVLADGSPDPDSLHEGEAPMKCEKFAMNVWVTDKALTEAAWTAKKTPKHRPGYYEVVHSHLVARAKADVTSDARAVLKKGMIVDGTLHEVNGSPWLLLSRAFCDSTLQLREDVFGEVWVLIHGKSVGLGELLKPIKKVEADAKKATKAAQATKVPTPKPPAVIDTTEKAQIAAEQKQLDTLQRSEQLAKKPSDPVAAQEETAAQVEKAADADSTDYTAKEVYDVIIQYQNHLHRTRRFQKHDWMGGEVSWDQLERWARDEPTVWEGGVENLLGRT